MQLNNIFPWDQKQRYHFHYPGSESDTAAFGPMEKYCSIARSEIDRFLVLRSNPDAGSAPVGRRYTACGPEVDSEAANSRLEFYNCKM